MPTNPFFIDKTPSTSTALEVPAFPWVCADARRFVWEEALFEGNFLSAHYSPIGRCQSKENIYQKLRHGRFPREHLYAFELEADGQLLRDRWEWRGETLAPAPRPSGQAQLTIELAFDAPALTLKVHTLLDGTSFLVRWLEVYNAGTRPVALSRVYPWAGLIAAHEEGATILTRNAHPGFHVGRYRNLAWAMEGEFCWAPLTGGSLSVATRGHKYNPSLFMLRHDALGQLTLIHVETTQNVDVSFTHGHESNLSNMRSWGNQYVYAKAGLAGPAPLRVLEPGETVTTPAIHLGMVQGDLDAGVIALHEHLRASVIPKKGTGPIVDAAVTTIDQAPASTMGPVPFFEGADLVEYNHTGYTLNAQVSRPLLLQEVEMAAQVGIELFLVDAGWFGPADKAWHQSVGDWTENPILGEGGLLAVFDHARSLGMKCGLWMPPEVASPDAPIRKQKPDWFFPGSHTFDLLQPEVEEYVYRTICSGVERFRLDCFRIDAGTCDPGSRRRPDGILEDLSWRYFEKLYSIYERVRQRFPALIMENCSGGGGRSDLALLRRFSYTQITDNWDPPCQVRILNGMTLALTPQQCMPLVGSINMRSADLDFVIRTGMLGHFTASGVFPSVERSNQATLGRWRHGIDLYKQRIRPILRDCRVYHHTPDQDYRQAGEWVVLEYAAADSAAAIAAVFRLAGAQQDTYTWVARGLDRSRDYDVTFDNTGQTVRLPGWQLMTAGLPIRVPAALMSELLLLQAVTNNEPARLLKSQESLS